MHPHCDIYIVICPAEPHQGDGGLLRRPHEALRRAEDRATDPQRARLHRLHPHPLPKLEALAFRSVPTLGITTTELLLEIEIPHVLKERNGFFLSLSWYRNGLYPRC